MNPRDSDVSPALSNQALALALEARAAIEAWHSALAKRGLTPQSCLEAVRRTGGEAAVAKVQSAVTDTLSAHTEKVEREAMHSVPATRALSRRVVRRGGI